MKNFVLEPRMRSSIGGAFYPTGYSMVMFPSTEDANRIGHKLIENGVSGDEIYLLPAATILEEISPTVRKPTSRCRRPAPTRPPCVPTPSWRAKAMPASWSERSTKRTPTA